MNIPIELENFIAQHKKLIIDFGCIKGLIVEINVRNKNRSNILALRKKDVWYGYDKNNDIIFKSTVNLNVALRILSTFL